MLLMRNFPFCFVLKCSADCIVHTFALNFNSLYIYTCSVHLFLSQVTPFLSNWLVSAGRDNLKYVYNQVLGVYKAILSVSVHVWANLVPHLCQQYIFSMHSVGSLSRLLYSGCSNVYILPRPHSPQWVLLFKTPFVSGKKEKQKQKKKIINNKQKKKCLIAWSFCWIRGSEIRYFVWPSQCWNGWPSMSVYTFISLG